MTNVVAFRVMSFVPPDGATFVVSAARGDGDANWWIADLYAIDAQNNGAELWRSQPVADNWFWGHPLVANGMVYTGSLAGTVYGVSAQDGTVRWSQKLGTSIRGRPALSQGVLVVADRNGRVDGYDPASGAPKWDKPIELDSHALGDLVTQSDGSILVLTDGGKGGTRLVSIDPRTGATSDVVRP